MLKPLTHLEREALLELTKLQEFYSNVGRQLQRNVDEFIDGGNANRPATLMDAIHYASVNTNPRLDLLAKRMAVLMKQSGEV